MKSSDQFWVSSDSFDSEAFKSALLGQGFVQALEYKLDKRKVFAILENGDLEKPLAVALCVIFKGHKQLDVDLLEVSSNRLREGLGSSLLCELFRYGASHLNQGKGPVFITTDALIGNGKRFLPYLEAFKKEFPGTDFYITPSC